MFVPAAGGAPQKRVTAAIFYSPWYGTPAFDGNYRHWEDHGHTPPADIASSFYPARGVYSSSSPSVVDAQMREIARAGVHEVVASWWGKGSPEDGRLPGVILAARAHKVEVAAHLEPYDNRTIAGTAVDIAYLQTLGIRDFFVYHATDFPASDWAALTGRLSGVRLFAQTNLVGFAQQGGFDGVYSYDILRSGGATFRRVCDQAHNAGILCGPSVGPGYSARRATGDTRVKLRRNGVTYDAMWTAALRSGADLVTITSYNEWLEGTQIEPARRAAGYQNYEGAWHKHDAAARGAYLARTAYWTSRLARGR
jgi:glycoprotein endo-alpha-1,2-mannosidase